MKLFRISRLKPDSKTNRLTRFLLTCALLFALLLPVSCTSKTDSATDFNMIFGYGVGAKNVLDTFEGTYTKDMISAPSLTIDFNLTKEDMSAIYEKIHEIDFFSYPEVFSVMTNQTGTIGMVTPYETYYFKVKSGSETKEVRWENSILWCDTDGTGPWSPLLKMGDGATIISLDAARLYELVQDLPEPAGGYV